MGAILRLIFSYLTMTEGELIDWLENEKGFSGEQIDETLYALDLAKKKLFEDYDEERTKEIQQKLNELIKKDIRNSKNNNDDDMNSDRDIKNDDEDIDR